MCYNHRKRLTLNILIKTYSSPTVCAAELKRESKSQRHNSHSALSLKFFVISNLPYTIGRKFLFPKAVELQITVITKLFSYYFIFMSFGKRSSIDLLFHYSSWQQAPHTQGVRSRVAPTDPETPDRRDT